MYAQEIKRLRKLLRSDKQFKRIKKFFERVSSELSADGLYAEVRNLHGMRSSRVLERGGKAFIDRVVEANLQDQSYRSRLAEIQMDCAKTLSTYQPVVDDLVSYMVLEHQDALKNYFSSKADRADFVTSLCKEYLTFLREVEAVSDAAKTVIVDIDKAGYMFKNLIEAVKIVHERKS